MNKLLEIFIITILILLLTSITMANMAIADTYRYDNRTTTNIRITDQGGFQHSIVGVAWGVIAKDLGFTIEESIGIAFSVSFLKEMIDMSSVESKPELKEFILKEASDYQVMSLLVDGELPEEKENLSGLFKKGEVKTIETNLPTFQSDGTPVSCQFCKGQTWDNTIKPKKNPKGPDYRCRDTNCGAAAWIRETGGLNWRSGSTK